MSKRHTREEIINGRLCGLKIFDKAVSKVGSKAIIDKAIEIFQKNHTMICSDNPWVCFGWANANAIMEINQNWDDHCGANLDEMYDETEMSYIATTIGLKLPDTDARKRKKS